MFDGRRVPPIARASGTARLVFLDFLGYPGVVLTSDIEKAMAASQERAKRLCKQETVLANSKKADSKGNGMIERGI